MLGRVRNQLNNFQKPPLFWFFASLLVSVLSFYLLLRPGFFFMQDDMHAMRILQMDKCLANFQIPCRWVPDMGYGYGYPAFHYYAPLAYYLGEIFHLLGLSIIDSVKAVFVTSFILAASFMFIFGRALWGNLGGFTASIFYTFHSYRAVDAYVRGSLGELLGIAFLPLVFWGILQVVREGKKHQVIFLAVGFAGILTGHNLIGFFSIPLVIVWGIFLILLYGKTNLLKVQFGLVWGFLLAAFFVIPAIFERQFAHIETLLYGYFNYLAHFVDLTQLFVSRHFGYGSSELGSADDLALSLGHPHWEVAVIALFVGVAKMKKEKDKVAIIAFFTLLWLSSGFLTHSKSTPIWNAIPILAWLQFPWRFLAFAMFATSVISGSISYFVKGIKLRMVATVILITITIALNLGYFKPKNWYQISDVEKFSGVNWDKQQTISIFDYLPIYATLPPTQRAPEIPQTLVGEVEYLSYQKGTDYQELKIAVKSPKAIIRLPLFDFPGWKVKVDGKEVATNHQNFLGLVTFEVDSGSHDVKVKLTNTLPRTTGNLLTVLALGLIPAITLSKRWPKL